MRTYRELKSLTVPELSEEFKTLRPDLWKASMVKLDEGDLVELIQDAESEDEAKAKSSNPPPTEPKRPSTRTPRVKVETGTNGEEIIEVEPTPVRKDEPTVPKIPSPTTHNEGIMERARRMAAERQNKKEN